MCIARMHLCEQVALRMAAADFHQPRQGLAQLIDGTRVVASGMRQQPAAGRQADALARHPRIGPVQAGRMRLDVAHQGVGLRPAGARQAVEILHVQERQHLVLQPRAPGSCPGPASGRPRPHRRVPAARAARRVDLVLRVVLGHAPHLLVVQVQHFLVALQLQGEQRLVPPVVRDHEGVQAGPGGAHVLQEGMALPRCGPG